MIEQEMPPNVTINDGAIVGLPKWPALIVHGERVTKLQAAEILFRTNGLDFWSNSKRLENELRAIFGLVPESDFADIPFQERLEMSRREWTAIADLEEKYGMLNLEYLRNSRIVSAFIGGPHGWVDWDGVVFTNSYNIGKWPDVTTVAAEWGQIAEAFPYLDLTAQLCSGETSEPNSRPVVEFIVKEGQVTVQPPTKTLSPTVFRMGPLDFSDGGYGREMGIHPKELKKLIVQIYGEIYRVEK